MSNFAVLCGKQMCKNFSRSSIYFLIGALLLLEVAGFVQNGAFGENAGLVFWHRRQSPKSSVAQKSFVISMSKGFKPNPKSSPVAPVEEESLDLFSRIQVLDDDSKKCPCHSSLPYALCCKPMHTKPFSRPYEPTQLLRARYSAFYMGLVNFLMATSHSQSREAKKFMVDSLSSTQNYKAWTKELMQNSKLKFDYLALEIVQEDDEADQEMMKKLFPSLETCPPSLRTVRFRYISRVLSNRKLIPIEECSAFLLTDPLDHFFKKEIGESYLSPALGTTTTTTSASSAPALFYTYAASHVAKMDVEHELRLLQQIARYPSTGIGRRWK